MKNFILICFLSFSSIGYSQFWQQLNGSFITWSIMDIVVDNSGTIYAGSFLPGLAAGGMYKSTDSGNSWVQINNGLTDYRIVELALNASDDIFIGTEGGGIFRSVDKGDTWVQINNGLANLYVYKFIFDTDGSIFAGTGGGVFYSSNNGESWAARNTGLTLPKLHGLALNSSGTLFAGTYGAGMFRSTDKGLNWVPINNGFTELKVWTVSVTNQGIFSGTMHGMFRSTDNGNSWTLLTNGFFDVGVMIVSDVNSSGHIFAIELSHGIYRSTDNGNTWNATNSGLPIVDIVQSLGIDRDGFIYTESSGKIYRSINSTVTPVELSSFSGIAIGNNIDLNWKTASELNNRGFQVERKNTEGDFVTIGFIKGFGTTTEEQEYSYIDKDLPAGKYIYRLRQVDFNGTFKIYNAVEVEMLPEKFSLSQNYPNPFNPSTNISYAIPYEEHLTLKIFDILGNEIQTLVNELKPAGRYNINFNAANLPSGVYYYILQAGNYSETKKLLLLK